MKTLKHNRRVPLLALVALVGLCLTGCDVLDANAPLDAAQASVQTATEKRALVPPKPLATPFSLVPHWFRLAGTWHLDAPEGATLTFAVDLSLRLETACAGYDGTFTSTNEGALSISHLVIDLASRRCETFVEEPLVAHLLTVTDYAFKGERLILLNGKPEADLVFLAADTEDSPEDTAEALF